MEKRNKTEIYTDEMKDKFTLPNGMYKVISLKEEIMNCVIVELEGLGKVILSNWNGDEWETVHNAESGEYLFITLKPKCWVNIDGKIYERDCPIYYYCK